MHVMMRWAKTIETYDTAADGTAAMTKAALEVVRPDEDDDRNTIASLVLWAQLKNAYGKEHVEEGSRENIAKLDLSSAAARLAQGGRATSWNAYQVAWSQAETLNGFLDLMGEVGCIDDREKRGELLRCDVDGETIWEAETEDKQW